MSGALIFCMDYLLPLSSTKTFLFLEWENANQSSIPWNSNHRLDLDQAVIVKCTDKIPVLKNSMNEIRCFKKYLSIVSERLKIIVQNRIRQNHFHTNKQTESSNEPPSGPVIPFSESLIESVLCLSTSNHVDVHNMTM